MKPLHAFAVATFAVAAQAQTTITMAPFGIEANLDILCAQAGNPEYIGNNPAAVAFDAVGQLSATSAIPLGHMPPTPSPTRNRSTSICSCVVAKPPSPAQTE